ncbi:MAG: hypothetical protein ACOH1T_12015 [Microbacteriaceae bacterium]
MSLSTARRATVATALGAALALSLSGCFGSIVAPKDSTPTSPDVESSEEAESPDAKAPTIVEGDVVKTVSFDNGLKVDVVVLGYGVTTEDSNWKKDDGTNAYPKGTREAATAFVLTNTTDKPLNIRGFSHTGSFKGSDFFSNRNSSSTTATHVKLGYENAPYDTYGFDADEWLLAPGDSEYYADSIYVEASGLLITSLSVQETPGGDDAGYERLEKVEIPFKTS